MGPIAEHEIWFHTMLLRLVVVLWWLEGGEGSKATTLIHSSTMDESNNNNNTAAQTATKHRRLFLPKNFWFTDLLRGQNSCGIARGYFPKPQLDDLLPDNLSIPDAATMATYYPDTPLTADTHPFMLLFCQGTEIRDVFTNWNVPEQQELLAIFPVVYQHRGTTHLVSYIPVLYLDSFLGTLGGLFYGLRKEYHPDMTYGKENNDSVGSNVVSRNRWWDLEGIVEASFDIEGEEQSATALPQFFVQTYDNPFVSLSYRLPTKNLVFHKWSVEAGTWRAATASYRWIYKGATVVEEETTMLAAEFEYPFKMSWPMLANTYFAN